MAINRTICAFLSLTALLLSIGSVIAVADGADGPPGATLSARYPGDRGLARDPSVVFYENFAERDLHAILERYESHANTAGMAVVDDHPETDSSRGAIRLTAGRLRRKADLYKSFGTGYDELFVRYYIKYIGNGPWHHSGVWIGGYNPPLLAPFPRAGLKPTGTDLFSIGLEPISEFPFVPMDLYTYWMGMHSWRSTPTNERGDYYGNTLLHDADFRVQSNLWQCYEIHLRLNALPLPSFPNSTGSGPILEVWANDRLIRRFDDHGPLGYWVRDKFCGIDATGTECTRYRPSKPVLVLLDQRWRNAEHLKINYLWAQNYNTAITKSSLLIDDIVVATQRIGCIEPRR